MSTLLRRQAPRPRRDDVRAARRREGSYAFQRRDADPFMHQEMIEILYHTLWETVHVFFEHRELGHDVGDAASSIRFSGQAEAATRDVSRRGRGVDPDEGGGRRAAAAAGRAESKPSVIAKTATSHRASGSRAAAS